MSLSKTDLQKLARLAALELNEQELESLGSDLRQILAYVAQLDRLDTTSVEPLTHPTIDVLRERRDRVEKTLTRSEALANAPSVQEDMFKVPPVLDGSES